MTGAGGSVGPELRTRRVELSPFAREDASALLELFREPGMRRYLLDDALVDRTWIEGEIEASTLRFRESGAGLWALRFHGKPDIVGFAGFRPFFDPPRLQLLYGLAPGARGHGVATEVAGLLCRHGLDVLGLGTIEAAVDVPNRRSVAVLERLGMTAERTTDDGPAGTVFYRLEPGA